ncbi:MAG: hypothetical protein WBR21_15355 [Rouxiella badensis]|uniref:hypothetical protein n=1 Tax=Rouxiella badensis TaxID=1646377 RepID=UPI003C333F14
MNAFNVWTKAFGPLTMTQEELDNLGSQGIKRAAEVNAINDARRQDDGWRDELDELSRRFKGQPSVDAAESRLAELKSSVKRRVAELSDKIAKCSKALKDARLSRLEATHVEQRKKELEEQLGDFQRDAERQLAFAKGAADQAKQWEPSRGRWEELKKRAREVDAALAQV